MVDMCMFYSISQFSRYKRYSPAGHNDPVTSVSYHILWCQILQTYVLLLLTYLEYYDLHVIKITVFEHLTGAKVKKYFSHNVVCQAFLISTGQSEKFA